MDDPTLATMETALRVCYALSQKQTPEPNDVADLVVLAGPQPEGLDLHELTRMAVQTALKKHQDWRRSSEVWP
jgi:hypothetical protein